MAPHPDPPPEFAGLRRTAGRPLPHPGPQTVAQVLDRGLAEHPDRPALIDAGESLTHAELDARLDRACGLLAELGVGPGDRVAATLPNRNAIVELFLASQRCGAIWVGVNTVLAPPEKRYLLADSGATVWFATPQVLDETDTSELGGLAHAIAVDEHFGTRLDASVARRPDLDIDPFGPAAIAYTSGTTGFPKGAVHSQHNLLLPGAVTAWRQGPDSGGRLGVVLPLTILNLMVLGPLVAFQTGGTCLPMERIDTLGIVDRVRRDAVNSFSATPAVVYDLLTNPDVDADALATLDGLGVGGANLPTGLRELYIERFGRSFAQGYGLTEAPTAVTLEDDDDRPAGATGKALPQVQLSIRDEADRPLPPGAVGEVCVGPADEGEWAGVYTPMLGYWGKPDATAEALRDGWLHTGDLGHLDERGNLFIADRRNDLIIRGGANVYPAEVERVLHGHPAVADCAVVGRPDARLGEIVVAFVQPVAGAELDGEALAAHCRNELARYKVPVEWHAVDEFPRNAMRKIVKPELRRLLES